MSSNPARYNLQDDPSKQLVACFGIDPSVKKSGKFNSTKNRMSKRGSYTACKAIFHIAVTSISTRKGVPVNKVLLEYYNSLKNKPKKGTPNYVLIQKQSSLANNHNCILASVRM